jgi:histidinol dehydrogenase
MSGEEFRRLDTEATDFDVALKSLLRRDNPFDSITLQTVQDIIADVRDRGDIALCEYTARYDDFEVLDAAKLEISSNAQEAAFKNLPSPLRQSLEVAAKRIQDFHERQKASSWEYDDGCGSRLGQRLTPLERIGVYIPGGKAAYPSSILMTAIPARIAGVTEIVMVVPTPQGKDNNLVLAASHLAGVDRVFRIGGAQAVAALALGTDTVPRVDKIVGPGNAYVVAAKKALFGEVGIDMIAGPSEVVIIADSKADPKWLAMDLFAQAEHDASAQSILLSPDVELINQVETAMQQLLPQMERYQTIASSLAKHGALIKVESLAAAVDLSNRIAPEHLQLMVEDPEPLLNQVRHAGAIFCGYWSAEALGDYCVGPNHVLPTAGTARFSSPLGVYDFQKRTSIIWCSPPGAAALSRVASTLAEHEGLFAHARSAAYRGKDADRGR